MEKKQENEEKLLEFFEDRLRKSGFSFESKVERKLRKYFDVKREFLYFDKDGSDGRKIDFRAKTVFPVDIPFQKKKEIPLGSLVLPIECKSLPDHAWIFFRDQDHGGNVLDPNDCVIWKENKKIGKTVSLPPLMPIHDILYASSFVEFFFSNKKEKDISLKEDPRINNRDTNLYEAVLAVTKATRHMIELEVDLLRRWKEKGVKSFPFNQIYTVFQPAIIFNGRMYEAIQKNDDISLEPIGMVQIEKRYLSSKYQEQRGTIHIVSHSYLDKYIEILKSEFYITDDFISFMKNEYTSTLL